MKKQLCRHLAVFFILILPALGAIRGQIWQYQYPPENLAVGIVELPSRNLVFVDSIKVHCVDRFGQALWSDSLIIPGNRTLRPYVIDMSGGNRILIVGYDYQTISTWMISMDTSGNVLRYDSLRPRPIFDSFRALPAGDFMYGSLIQGGFKVQRYDSLYNLQWFDTIPQPPGIWPQTLYLSETNNGDILATGVMQSFTPGLPHQVFAVRYSGNGTILWSKSYSIPQNVGAIYAAGAVESPQGDFLIRDFEYGSNTAIDTTRFIKVDLNGDSLTTVLQSIPGGGLGSWERLFRTRDGFPATLGFGSNQNGDVNRLRKLDWNASVQWSMNLSDQGQEIIPWQAIPLADSGFAVVGARKELSPTAWQYFAYVTRLDVQGYNFKNLLQCRAYYDLNSNCIRDPGELAVPNIPVALTGDTSLYFSTDTAGFVEIKLDTGTFSLQVVPNSYYWGLPSCAGPFTANFQGSHDTILFDIPLEPAIVCPNLTVDIASPARVVCFPADFTVTYQNTGTATATNAYVDVEMPPSLTVDSASIPWVTPQSGNNYRFLLGNIAMLQSGGFEIHTTIDCPSNPLDLLQHTECAMAHIYPDSSCLPTDASWDGSSVAVEIACLGSNVRMVIRNTSSSAMVSPGGFIVLEDNILRLDSTFQLLGNDSLVLNWPANGSTWTLFAEQRPSHPGNSYPMAAIEGCGTNTNNGISLGFLSQFPQDDAYDFISIECKPYVGAYDPNDKTAAPEGIGIQHYVAANRELEYMIRFQNTGSWFALNVSILDTLEPDLDPLSIRVLSASHPFQWQLLPGSILRFDFLNIMLPDSTSDEPGSHGFLKYEISPISDLPPGQHLENRASIYFDFNPPIITNTVFHTIDEPMFGYVGVEQGQDSKGIGLTVFPNPFRESTTFRLGTPLLGPANFSVRNLQGQVVCRKEMVNAIEFTFEAGQLSPGLYLFDLQGQDGKRASGKIMLLR